MHLTSTSTALTEKKKFDSVSVPSREFEKEWVFVWDCCLHGYLRSRQAHTHQVSHVHVMSYPYSTQTNKYITNIRSLYVSSRSHSVYVLLGSMLVCMNLTWLYETMRQGHLGMDIGHIQVSTRPLQFQAYTHYLPTVVMMDWWFKPLMWTSSIIYFHFIRIFSKSL